MNKPRYTITYWLKDKPKEIQADNIHDANALYDMVDSDADFKVLVDNVSGEQLKQS